MAPQNDPIDMSKLSQRELLILLNQKVASLSTSLESTVKQSSNLHDRILVLETSYKVWISMWGGAAVLLTLVLNLIKIFYVN